MFFTQTASFFLLKSSLGNNIIFYFSSFMYFLQVKYTRILPLDLPHMVFHEKRVSILFIFSSTFTQQGWLMYFPFSGFTCLVIHFPPSLCLYVPPPTLPFTGLHSFYPLPVSLPLWNTSCCRVSSGGWKCTVHEQLLIALWFCFQDWVSSVWTHWLAALLYTIRAFLLAFSCSGF